MKNFFLLPKPNGLHPAVVRHFKRNFLTNILDAGFWFFGDSFVASYTILPVFMSTITDSPILIGMIPALEGAGWFLPQLFFAKYLEGKNRRLPIVLRLGILDRIPYLILALCAFLVLKIKAEMMAAIFLLIYTIKVVSAGLVALPWQELIATVIPVSHRGRFWGLSMITGKSMGMAGAAITGLMLTKFAYPKNYAYMFLVGFACSSISYLFLSLNIEPEIERAASKTDLSILVKIKEILADNRNFGIFLINRGLVFLSFMGLGFIAVYGLARFNLPISYSAIFTGVMLISEILGFGIWGILGDKYGYKRVIETSNLFNILGLAMLLFVKNTGMLYIVFSIISFAHSGEYIADQNIAMEFGAEKDRPTYIGMSKTLIGPFLLAAPIIGGGIVKLWGYPSMFLTALTISILAFFIIRFFVEEPRQSDILS